MCDGFKSVSKSLKNLLYLKKKTNDAVNDLNESGSFEISHSDPPKRAATHGTIHSVLSFHLCLRTAFDQSTTNRDRKKG